MNQQQPVNPAGGNDGAGQPGMEFPQAPEPEVTTEQVPTPDPGYSGQPYATAQYPVAGTPAGYPTSAYPAPGHPGTYPASSEARRPSGIGRAIIVGALAVALAGGGGVVGALTMHSLDKSSSTTSTTSGAHSTAPIVDRSSLASIAAAVRPSVVSITTGTAEGSGVILSADGYILTNNHVAATAQGQNVDITFDSGRSAKASLVGTDPKTDLAVFKAQGVSGLTVAAFGDSNALQVGDTVLAIGSPLGLEGSVTAGIISALNRTIDENADSQPQNPFGQSNPGTTPSATIAGAIQTDAAINPGNSGGALVNTNGQVVGINTAIATSGNGADGNIGVGFSIPSNRAKQVADALIKGVKVSHPQLGVEVTTADSNAGALVRSVQPGSAADKAGLKVGDVVTGFNSKDVHTQIDLVNDVQASSANTTVTLTVLRGTSTLTLNVTLGEAK